MDTDLTQATVVEIANFYKSPDVRLRANMVISKDGHFVDLTGSSRGLSSPLDLKVLLTLRAISDVVLVGAQTVRAEDYRPPKLAGEYLNVASKPARLAVLSRSLKFDLSSRLFSDSENQPIIFSELSSDVSWIKNRAELKSLAEVVVLEQPIELAKVISWLDQAGLSKIVCEGGPEVLTELLSSKLVDELDITQSPVELGFPAKQDLIHECIETWPNRLTAKLGEHELFRIWH